MRVLIEPCPRERIRPSASQLAEQDSRSGRGTQAGFSLGTVTGRGYKKQCESDYFLNPHYGQRRPEEVPEKMQKAAEPCMASPGIALNGMRNNFVKGRELELQERGY